MKYMCKNCETIKDCKHAFGIYWAYRSHMGQGCDLQFRYQLPERKPRYFIPPPKRNTRR